VYYGRKSVDGYGREIVDMDTPHDQSRLVDVRAWQGGAYIYAEAEADYVSREYSYLNFIEDFFGVTVSTGIGAKSGLSGAVKAFFTSMAPKIIRLFDTHDKYEEAIIYHWNQFVINDTAGEPFRTEQPRHEIFGSNGLRATDGPVSDYYYAYPNMSGQALMYEDVSVKLFQTVYGHFNINIALVDKDVGLFGSTEVYGEVIFNGGDNKVKLEWVEE